MLLILDMHDPGAAHHQHIGHQRAVAAPPEHFGAHHAGAPVHRQLLQPLQANGKFTAGGVVRVTAKGGIAPGHVDRIRRGPSPAAQFGDQLIFDTGLVQAGAQGFLAELGQAAGAGKAPDIGYGFDPVVVQQGDEFLDRAGRVADGPDGFCLGHGHLILVRASSRCMAIWSVLSLLISYCGDSLLARRG